jgi:hypothetical protein
MHAYIHTYIHTYMHTYTTQRNGDVTGSNQYVISRYIEHPLLVGGRKFDLRIYVLVTGYNPLRAYVHRQVCLFYVCMHVCMYVLNMHSYTTVLAYTNVSAVYLHCSAMHANIAVAIRTYLHIQIHILEGKRICTHTDIHMHIHACPDTYTHAYMQGFARFCTAKYSSNLADVDNVLMHLTNVSVQKQAEVKFHMHTHTHTHCLHTRTRMRTYI